MPRRRRRKWGRGIDWLEAVTVGLGMVFAALAVVCVVSLVGVLASLGESPARFPGGPDFLPGLRGLGLALVAVGALVFGLVAWWLLADPVRSILRRRRER
jgi:hypothetical protein